MLHFLQPALVHGYFLWILGSFCTQSVAQKAQIPAIVTAIGLKSSHGSAMAFLSLLAQTAVAVILTAVNRPRPVPDLAGSLHPSCSVAWKKCRACDLV